MISSEEAKSFLSIFFLEEITRVPKAKEAALAVGTLESCLCCVSHFPSRLEGLQVMVSNLCGSVCQRIALFQLNSDFIVSQHQNVCTLL